MSEKREISGMKSIKLYHKLKKKHTILKKVWILDKMFFF